MVCHIGELKDYPTQFFYQGSLVFPGQVGHVGNVDPGFFGQREGQGLRCGIYTGNVEFLLDGALGEHIRFSDKVAIAVCDLQGGQQEIGVVIMECRVIGPLGNTAIFFYKAVI